LRVEKRSAEVKVSEVERAEVGILGDDSVEDAVEGNEGSDVGRGRARRGKAVTTRSSMGCQPGVRRGPDARLPVRG
jgi:hypothetical protein